MGRRVPQVVSLVDVVATMVEVAGAPATGAPLDGDSLRPLAWGATAGERAESGAFVAGDTHAGVWKDEAFSEYLAHGVARPMAMLRRGRWKLNYSLDDAPELYDLETDPGELHDLAADPSHAPVREALRARLLARWDPVDLERRVRQSQQERLLIHAALHT
jgi:choline-sulfatase